MEQAVFKGDSGEEICIAVSIGVTALPEQATTLQELVIMGVRRSMWPKNEDATACTSMKNRPRLIGNKFRGS